ncbi:hypothetical protein L3Q82_002520 [Scortum barcoo]|uniref:Uncharacterized protein n=1 Tax=Scortum barcoo TaxID=214431 RepID=A0ACB8VZ00_9TELE|nr:hypothetical protein L3Q82_002520 [Scortum barcoo]
MQSYQSLEMFFQKPRKETDPENPETRGTLHSDNDNLTSISIGNVRDYKKKISSAEVMSASLPDKLNTFYARFESTSPAVEVQKAQEDHCQSVVPTCFKETIIVPVHKETKILCLDDYHPVALTSTIMKCFERFETAYREEVRALTSWCQDNNLHLNVSKTKELIVDFRRRQREEHAPLSINGTTVERVNSFRFLGVHIREDFTWTHHKVSQTAALLPLQAVRRLNMDFRILCSFYREDP